MVIGKAVPEITLFSHELDAGAVEHYRHVGLGRDDDGVASRYGCPPR